ncbi:MAG: hypothetical protein IJM98_11415 [Oscillospiraceae bacterium]|nr:hypothetical protein [Oscillospiraceae bacterium]MBQ6701255.1 hypothetical protein [Oscillospiraceae bacterium]
MEHSCKCKKGGKGHNYIPERITVFGEGGKEITNRDLVCHHCAYKKRGDTSSCLRFEAKPPEVLAGGKCDAFLSTGHDLGQKSHECDGCGDCGDCKSCENGCGGECDGCVECK